MHFVAKIFLIFSYIVLPLNIPLSYAMGDLNDVGSKVPMAQVSSSNDSEDCKSRVIFQIGKVSYQVDPKQHVSFEWRDLNAIRHSRSEIKGIGKGCLDFDLGKIEYFVMTPRSGITISTGEKKITTNFLRYKNAIIRAQESGTVEEMADGVKKMVFNTEEIFLLPIDMAPSADGDPVVVACSGLGKNKSPTATCTINFLHKDGNYIAMGFLQKQLSEHNMIDAYKKVVSAYTRYIR